ncbi:hypothetical protein GCM10011450_24290 [Advenella faeciporci]|uniref:Uncharacterized protein n=1 Tax=Advenella faeciporci TaxID=797535 RepID=A0A918N0I0_9BURK|nr:hypothetical protein [Advenella faeciporci]GGW93403.1 hypothetical protein GCM10011450_24290 [Advenella faeciporci]
MLEFLLVLIYSTSLITILFLLFILIKRSEFGILVFFNEIMFLVIGICIYPIFIYFDLVITNETSQYFLNINNTPSLAVALHILLYCLSAFLGYTASLKNKSVGLNFFHTIATYINPSKLFYRLILFGLVIYFIFFQLVGFDTALINASAARSGFLDGFGENQKYLFLKTLAKISLYSVIFLPWILLKKKTKTDYIFIVLYIILLLFTYFNNFGRGMWLEQLIIPFFIIARYKLSPKNFIKLIPLIFLAYIILIYGKTFGHSVSAYFQGETIYKVSTYQADHGFFSTIFNNVSFAWYSIQAGITNFFTNGPYIPKDIVYSIWGFIPVKVLESIGLKDLYYGYVDSGLACVNTRYFSMSDCTIPPLLPGYSAYFFPFIGAIFFGFIKFYLIGILEKMWLHAKKTNYFLICIPYFFYEALSSILNLIPTHTSLIFFTLFLFFTYIGIIKLLRNI